jgi:ubiquinone/menaquinone biosynthesis C-methylase UbiE
MRNLWWRTVRFGFRLLYNEMAFTYDTVSRIVSLGDWHDWQQTALGFLPPPSAGPVLEVAHGTGTLQCDLKAMGYRTIGYDLSAAMGRIATRKLERQGYTPVLVRGIAQDLPFPDDTFAAVVCTFPTAFIRDDATIRSFERVLRPGAQVIIVLSGQFTSTGFVQAGLEWLYRITGQRSDAIVDALDDLVAHYNRFDLTAKWHRIDLKRSEAILLVAEKLV